ncbi:MAG TPA: fatty acid desaturase [Polyangia bacterium]|nr:fatty acid desaturase [Polyangia bacterium]
MTPSPETLSIDAGNIAKLQPWKWPWYRAAPGEQATFRWMMLIHVSTLVGLVLCPIPGWKLGFAAWAIFFMGGLGTTVAFHRAIAHKTLKLNPVVRDVLTFFAMLNGSGSPLSWAANHRLHHAKSDTPDDVSSPRVGGFWWSHLKWLWQAGGAPVSKYCKELNTPTYQKWTRWQVPIFAFAFLMGIPIALIFHAPVLATFFWLGPIRLVWALHAQCFVNSICHINPSVPEGEQTARNIPLLGVMHAFQGEQWHQNHHDRPGSARLGFGPGQLDVGWLTIVMLEKLGLATDVRRPDLRESVEKAA